MSLDSLMIIWSIISDTIIFIQLLTFFSGRLIRYLVCLAAENRSVFCHSACLCQSLAYSLTHSFHTCLFCSYCASVLRIGGELDTVLVLQGLVFLWVVRDSI